MLYNERSYDGRSEDGSSMRNREPDCGRGWVRPECRTHLDCFAMRARPMTGGCPWRAITTAQCVFESEVSGELVNRLGAAKKMRKVLEAAQLPPKLLELSADEGVHAVEQDLEQLMASNLTMRVHLVGERIKDANFTGAGDQEKVLESRPPPTIKPPLSPLPNSSLTVVGSSAPAPPTAYKSYAKRIATALHKTLPIVFAAAEEEEVEEALSALPVVEVDQALPLRLVPGQLLLVQHQQLLM